ncbi:Nimrod A [Carabus blaptoides fortunei]
MWLTIAFLLFVGVAIHAQRFNGDHVCQHQEKYTVLVEKHYKKNVTIREFVWCANFPPRCSKYKIVQKDDVRIEEEERFRIVDKCCDGYAENKNRTECVPVCRECVHGSCKAPMTCICTAGFSGSACNQTCPTGRWGLGCANQCDCRNGAACNAKTGYCQCLPDWTGSKCDHPISPNSSNCSEKNCSVSTDLEIPQENTKDSDERHHLDDKTGIKVQEANKTEAQNSLSQQENVTLNSSQPQMETGNQPEENEMKHTTVTTKSFIIPVITEATDLSKKNFNDIGEIDRYSVENSEHLFMDEIRIVKNSSDINKYGNLVSSISIAIAVAIILILIAIISILIARYKKRRNLITQKELNASDTTDNNNKNRLSSEPILRRSSYNAPLPDPPIFQNPVFTLTSDNNSALIISDIGVHYTNGGGANELLYDYPPSTGSYRAACIPEPETEPLYDEIPVWKQPKPITEPLSPGVCTAQCGHSCRDGAICEWQMKT